MKRQVATRAGSAVAAVLIAMGLSAPSVTAGGGSDPSPQNSSLPSTLEAAGFEVISNDDGNYEAFVPGLTRSSDDVADVLIVSEDSRVDDQSYHVGQQSDETLIVLPDVSTSDALEAIRDWTGEHFDTNS